MQVFSAVTGAFLRKFGGKGVGNGQFDTPLAVAVDVDGRVLVTDKNDRVQVFDPQGNFILKWGKHGRKDGEFNYPSCIAVDDEGSIFVCDSSNSRVQVFSGEGKFLHKWGGHKKHNKADAAEGAEAAEGEEAGEGEEHVEEVQWEGMKKPMGIAIARDGTIWVADQAQNEILVY